MTQTLGPVVPPPVPVLLLVAVAPPAPEVVAVLLVVAALPAPVEVEVLAAWPPPPCVPVEEVAREEPQAAAKSRVVRPTIPYRPCAWFMLASGGARSYRRAAISAMPGGRRLLARRCRI